ncbi:MAG TPA: sn-glycerol-3-phosphate ABC transporter ATP-binding protein UgpC [Thermoanaerobaculia bacterium]|nr:sn-glycerol-3-phosphate ABC transporter ATP-binding protein UgpC [Thermoanaerobaculia bacterium]
MAQVRFEHVGKKYDGVSVIEDLNLDVRDQEFMVLVGPSGCGKSTALRMIAGLEEISEGKIQIGDRVVNDLPPRSRDIAMVFQSYALYPHMTVRENLEFGLKIRRLPAVEIEKLIEEAAGILEIAPLLERRPKQLSGGQRQRVALGRAIVRKPAVFLFDEPLSNLDAKLRVQMRAEIKMLQHRLKTTTVYVTHDQTEAMTMGSRIAVMKDGRIQQVGAPLEVYDRPQNIFVANFIGTPPMNFIPATIRDGGATLAAGTFALAVPASLRPAAAGRDGQEVIVGVRPEHIVDPSASNRAEVARLTVDVEVVEPLGDEAIVHARAGKDQLVSKADPRRTPAVGRKWEVGVELDRLHLFDRKTGARL